MKKLLTLVLVLCMAVCPLLFNGCDDDVDNPPTGEGEKGLDYARDVRLNTEKYPELAEQGLFWWGWDTEDNLPIIEHSASPAGVALVDTSKPTVIFVHGWGGSDKYSHLSRAYYKDGNTYTPVSEHENLSSLVVGRVMLNLNRTLVDLSDLGTDAFAADGTAYYAKAWLDAGYNFGTFWYNKFCSDSIDTAEQAIYFADKISVELQGDAPIAEQGTLTPVRATGETLPADSYDATQYSLSQFFAAEYLRAINALPDTMGNAEIRIAGHSLGGIMTVTSTRVLSYLKDEGQLPARAMPDRIALLDTYMGIFSVAQRSWADMNIAWSGEKPVNGSTSATYESYVKYLSEHDVAVELYLLKGGIVPILSQDGTCYRVMKHAATVIVDTPMFELTDKFGAGHVGVLDWYAFSITSEDMIISGTTKPGVCAAMPTADLWAEKGNIYVTSPESSETFIFKDYVLDVADKTTPYNGNGAMPKD